MVSRPDREDHFGTGRQAEEQGRRPARSGQGDGGQGDRRRGARGRGQGRPEQGRPQGRRREGQGRLATSVGAPSRCPDESRLGSPLLCPARLVVGSLQVLRQWSANRSYATLPHAGLSRRPRGERSRNARTTPSPTSERGRRWTSSV